MTSYDNKINKIVDEIWRIENRVSEFDWIEPQRYLDEKIELTLKEKLNSFIFTITSHIRKWFILLKIFFQKRL